MKESYVVSIDKFRKAYEKVGWVKNLSKDGRYIVWSHPTNTEVWTRLPAMESASDYPIYQEKNLLMLLYAFDRPEDDMSKHELLSQLKNYNYKLINRIIGKNNKLNSTIPYELSSIVPEKNIEAFRHFYLTKSKSTKSLPIERFELNHTEVGSFVIPVSIAVEDEKNLTMLPLQNDTNIILHKYLDAIETLSKIPRKSANDFADRVIEESIDSKIVKDFFGTDKSIARFTEKYSNQVSNVLIGSKGSMILDYGLEQEMQRFKEVDISGIGVLKEEFLTVLEEREIEADDTKLQISETKIDVIVEEIARSGKVKFTVTGIGGDELKRPFKALSADLPQAKLDIFAEMFKKSGATTLSGDISKNKGKIGKIVVDNIGPKSSKSENLNILDNLDLPQ